MVSSIAYQESEERINIHNITREAYRCKDNYLNKPVPEAILAIAVDIAKYQSLVDQIEIETLKKRLVALEHIINRK